MRARRARNLDRAIAAIIFALTVAYLAAFPRDLAMSDESYFLYEAARIRNGEVMYRDIFQFITPLSSYVMALLFWIFGTTIETARLSTAVLHGLVTLLLFAIGRRLAIRPVLAVAPALAYLALCQSVWPYASWHWYSTLLTTLLLWSMLGRGWQDRPRAALVPGLISGALLAVQQQKGVMLAAGMGLIFLLDHLLRRRSATAESPRLLALRLLHFAVGSALVIVPVLLTSIAAAGFGPVYDDLVRWPLETYAPSFRVRWGQLGLLARSYGERTYPSLLRFSPAILLPLGLRALVALWSKRGDDTLATANILLLSAGASIVSILYYPDVIHIAFIAPVLLVCAAEAAEWALAQLRHPALAGALGWTAVGATTLVLGARLDANLKKARSGTPYVHETAFGKVAFAEDWRPIFIDRVREALRDVPSRELFVYANVSSLYLTTGAHNPTPFQFFLARTSPQSQTHTVLEILERRRLPYIVGVPFFMRPDDPVVLYIEANYERVLVPGVKTIGDRQPLELYRRIDRPRASGEP